MPAPEASAPVAAGTPVTLFYSYAHEDEPLRDELQDHLMILERRGVVRSWHDRAIVPGHDWNREIDEHLGAADVVLLLISKDFIASDYIMGAELKLAMQRQRTGDAVVVPILLRQVDLQPEDAADMPFVGLLGVQGLPRDLRPVTSWPNRDEAWTNVAAGLRATVKEIRARRPAPRSDNRDVIATGSPIESPLLAHVVEGFTQRIRQANSAKGGPALDEGEVRSQARRLIDVPESKRVLWVDDHPENNTAEVAALAKLQIEVAAVRSTEEALARLSEAAGEGTFDLVISDWGRNAEGPLAGLRLLAAMRERGHAQPVVYYHGVFDVAQRAALVTTSRTAGAFGEAVLPDELMRLVLAALNA